METGILTDKSKVEKAIMVAVGSSTKEERVLKEQLNELAFLALTSGAKVLKQYIQYLSHPDQKTYVGKGKYQEIKEYIEENEVEAVIFNDDLNPSQVRVLEQGLKCTEHHGGEGNFFCTG